MHGLLQFIAVGTPPDEDGAADLQYVVAAAMNVGRFMTEYKVVVDKSTVPVGTADAVHAVLAEQLAVRGVSIDYSAVSYTHLDVYKRQCSKCWIESCYC